MSCNTIEYKGIQYDRDEFVDLVKEGKINLPSIQARKDDLDVDVRDFKTMPFRFADKKITADKKTITVRPYSYNMGTYRASNNKLYNVFPQGRMYFGEYLQKAGMSASEFRKKFVDDEDIKYKHMEDFLNNKVPLYLYRIEKVSDKDDIIPEISDPRFARVYENRRAIIKRTKAQMKAEKDPMKKEELRQRVESATEQATRLKDDETRTFNTLFSQMKNDVETAKKILDTKTDERSINYAKSLVANYVDILTSDFADIVYSKNLDPALKQDILNFIGEAGDVEDRLNKHALALADNMIKKLSGKSQLKFDGSPIAVDDTNLATGWIYDSRWNKNPIVQSITHLIRSTQVAVNHMIVEFRSANKKLVQAIRKAGYNFDFMIQTDDEGKKTGLFVARESSDYKEAKAKAAASTDFNQHILFYAQNHDFKVNDEAWKRRKAFLIDYYKNNNTITLTDWDVANNVTLEEKVEAEALKKAMQKDPHIMRDIFDRIKNNPSKITTGDRKFFQEFLQYGGFRAENVDGEWIKPLEMTAHNKWVDPKWTAIQAMAKDDPRRAFYDHWTKYIQEGRRMRRDEDSYLPWNFIPEKYKPLGMLTKAQQLAHDHLGQRLSINKGDIDPETGEVEKKIPLYMLNGVLSPENKSYDLGDVLEDFFKETVNYHEKSQIEEPINLMLSMLKQQQVYDTNPDGSVKVIGGQKQYKPGISNNFLQTAHRINAQLYGEYQDQELVTGWKLYNKEEKDKLKDIKAKVDALDMSDDERQEALQYTSSGATYEGNNPKIIAFIDLVNKYKSVQENAHNFTGSKAANSLMFLTSVKYLGLNLFAGFGEILQGFTSLFTESAGGTYFKDKNAAKGMGIMMRAMTPWNTDLKEKVTQFAKIFDTVGDIFHESEGRLKGSTESWAFAQYRLANFQTNTAFGIAMFDFEKVKDKNGVEHSLWNAMDFKDGKVSWNKDIDIPLYEDGKPTQYLIDLNHKVDEILALNRERKTFMDPIKVDSKMVGRLLGQFKKNWMIGMFYNRFGNYREPNLTGNGKEFKGFYRSFWDEITKLPKVEDPVTGEMVPDTSLRGYMSIPKNFLKFMYKFSFIGKKMGAVKPGEFSELEEANLRKFMRELSYAMTISTAMLVLSGMNGGDDKDPLRTYFINQLTRLQRDVMTFMSPSDFTSFLKNPAPAVSSITDYTAIWDAAIKSTVLGDPYNSKGQLRIWNATRQNIPFYNQINNMKSKFDQAVTYGKY